MACVLLISVVSSPYDYNFWEVVSSAPQRRGKAVAAIVANGSEIAPLIGVDAPEITARFRNPGGNVIGIYQERAS